MNTPAPIRNDSPLYTPMARKITYLSVGLFVLSLPFNCYCTTGNCASSFMAFILGGVGMLSGGAAIAWLANPLLIASWMITRKVNNASLFISVGALLMALSFLLFDEILNDEGGGKRSIVSYQPGYWLWLLSTMVMVALNVILIYRRNLEWGRQGIRKRYH